MPGSGADETSVECAGEGDVGSALDESAAVGEEGEGVRGQVEAEEEVVVANAAVRGEADAHGGEVDRAVVLVNLDGVAAAESDVGAADAGEMGEDALAADSAGGVWAGGVDLAVLIGPEIVREEGAAHEVGLAGEELESFGDLEGGGEVDGGGEDAEGVAGFNRAGGWGGEDAGKAGSREQGVGSRVPGRRFGEDVHRCGVGADGGGVDPGFGLLDGIVVDEVAGFEVVGGVEYEICRG